MSTAASMEPEFADAPALFPARERFERLFPERSMLGGEWEWDYRVGRAFGSDGFLRLMGLDGQPFDGSLDALLAVVHEDDRDEVRDFIDAVRGQESTRELLWRVRGDDFERTLLCRAVLQNGHQGHPIRFLAVLVDVTDTHAGVAASAARVRHLEREAGRREAETLRMRQELDVLRGAVAIDLHQPLHAVHGFIDLFCTEMGDSLGESGREALTRVREASQQVMRELDSLLELSRLHRTPRSHKPVDLSLLARAAGWDMAERNPGAAVSLVVEENLTVEGDKLMLQTMMRTLLGNAWKCSPTRPDAEIHVGIREDDDGPVFFVRDNGADEATWRDEEKEDPSDAAGAGSDRNRGPKTSLALAFSVAARHGWRLWTETTPGNSATFCFAMD